MRANPELFTKNAYYAVLDQNGVLIDKARDFEEAADKAFYSSEGPVFVDKSVEASQMRQNPEQPTYLRARQNAIANALEASALPVLEDIDWAEISLEETRARLRALAKPLYKTLFDSAKKLGSLHLGRGGIAQNLPHYLFSPAANLGILRENEKTKKILGGAYASRGVSFLPHSATWGAPFDMSFQSVPEGVGTFCSQAVKECKKTCLVFTGQRKMESGAYGSSWLYSQLLLKDPIAVLSLIRHSVLAWTEKEMKRGINLFYRLNVFSDLPWEYLAPNFIPYVVDELRSFYSLEGLPEEALFFYDYSKIPQRPGIVDSRGNPLYDITFSFTGYPPNLAEFVDILNEEEGCASRAAVVFVARSMEERAERIEGQKRLSMYRADPGAPIKQWAKKSGEYFPFTFFDHPIWNGDLSDIRPLDPEDVRVVGLYYKPAMYKVLASKESGKMFQMKNFVDPSQLDELQPRFLVRVSQPDPDAPPVVVSTQDRSARTLLPVFDG